MCLSKGQVVDADFSKYGVKLLFRSIWTPPYSYSEIEKHFKVQNQDENPRVIE